MNSCFISRRDSFLAINPGRRLTSVTLTPIDTVEVLTSEESTTHEKNIIQHGIDEMVEHAEMVLGEVIGIIGPQDYHANRHNLIFCW